MFNNLEKQQLKVPAHVDYLGDLRDFVTQIGRKHKFSDKLINAFKLAVDEAATNIIRHAYRESDGVITIRAIARKNSLTLSIIDQGIFFDPKRVKDPDLNRYIDIGKKGGLGIFIMRKLMDEIDYRKTEEGNELRITKYRESPEKKNIIRSVSSIPFSIKAKYFFRAVAIITIIIAIGYLYFFLKTDDEIISEFISSAQSTNRQIINRINSAPAEDFAFIEDVVYPIDEEYKGQISRISVEDSTGFIVYSSNVGEIFKEFSRPDNSAEISVGVHKYTLANEGTFYEFESPIVIKDLGVVYGKAHIFVSSEAPEKQITAIRLNNLQLALFILGMSCVGVALLIYLVMNPFRKLSDWIKNLGHGEIEDEMDIDASTEIGEIARAFSDITHKFRDSQKSLADQERLQKEMHVAQEIQQTLLPMEFPKLEGYEISAYYEAAKEVGGDYYDFVEVDKDTLGIAVADVSGKGVPGSLVMTMIRTALRTEARGLKDAAEVLARVNTFVSNDIKKGMFVTVFYLIIDSKKRCLNYASAGHNPMILYRGSTRQTYYLNPKGFPIGVQLPERDYFRNYIESDTIQLAKDDILLVYTDGITEAMNSRRELFGEERLQKVLSDYGHLQVEQFVEKLKDGIYSFTEGSQQYDDITLVAIKEESTREEDEFRRAREVHKLVSQGMSIRDACEKVNLTTYAYYNKYKKVFEEEGIDAFEIDESESVEAKHLSIEEKTKIFDIISNHPEYGASRIQAELNTEKYNFTELAESKIYEELVRNRLNTKPLREAYVNRAKRNKRRLKPPGTPFMTLDGNIVINETEIVEQKPLPTVPPREIGEKGKESLDITTSEEDKAVGDDDVSPQLEEHEKETPTFQDETVISDFEAESLLDAPIEEILSKDKSQENEKLASDLIQSDLPEPTEAEEHEETQDTHASLDEVIFGEEVTDSMQEETELESKDEDPSLSEDFSFEELFDSGSQIENDDNLEWQESENKEAEIDRELAEQPQDESTALEDEDVIDDAEFEQKILQVTHQEDIEDDELGLNQPEDEEEDSLTASSIDELLGGEQYEYSEEHTDDFSEGTTEPAEADVDFTEGQNEEEEETVSFSDLIQAIDDEIVYVSQPSNFEKADNKKEIELENELQSSGSNSSSISKVDKSNGDQKQLSQDADSGNNDIQDKEMILINGIKFYKNNNYEKAIEEFKKVIDVYPDYKEAHSILGNAYFRNKMYDEAAMAYKRVKEIDPGDITAYENMGVIYANRGEYKEAVGEWKKVMELSPERTDIEDKIRKALRMI